MKRIKIPVHQAKDIWGRWVLFFGPDGTTETVLVAQVEIDKHSFVLRGPDWRGRTSATRPAPVGTEHTLALPAEIATWIDRSNQVHPAPARIPPRPFRHSLWSAVVFAAYAFTGVGALSALVLFLVQAGPASLIALAALSIATGVAVLASPIVFLSVRRQMILEAEQAFLLETERYRQRNDSWDAAWLAQNTILATNS